MHATPDWLGSSRELKGHHDPACFCVGRTVHEGVIRDRAHHSVHVVLDVLLVVGQIRIDPAVARREKNAESAASYAVAETRSHRTLPNVVPNEWAFALIDESLGEALHGDGCRLSSSEIVADDSPPEPRHHECRADPQHREIDSPEPSKAVR